MKCQRACKVKGVVVKGILNDIMSIPGDAYEIQANTVFDAVC